jgi:hypothetical protein
MGRFHLLCHLARKRYSRPESTVTIEPLAKAAWGFGSLIEPRANITIVVRKRDLSPRSGIDQFVLQEAQF